MASKQKSKVSATLTDPLNWVLLILVSAFIYYVYMIPYWQGYYLKTPQALTFAEYKENPAHPRAPMLRSLGTPPSSVEVIIEGLTVKHVDTDSILLTSDATSMNAPMAGTCEMPTMGGSEMGAPDDEILLAGSNADLLGVSEGQQVSLQLFGLTETDLGWVPLEPTLDADQEQQYSTEELATLETLKIHAGAADPIEMPYVEVGELRFVDGMQTSAASFQFADLADDTAYINAVNDLSGGLADLWGVRLVEWQQENLNPFFIVEDSDGNRGHVYYNQRMLSEWRWALDRLQGRCVVVRGVLRGLTPPNLRQLDADGNIQALITGDTIMSPDGAVVISLENPAGTLLGGS